MIYETSLRTFLFENTYIAAKIGFRFLRRTKSFRKFTFLFCFFSPLPSLFFSPAWCLVVLLLGFKKRERERERDRDRKKEKCIHFWIIKPNLEHFYTLMIRRAGYCLADLYRRHWFWQLIFSNAGQENLVNCVLSCRYMKANQILTHERALNKQWLSLFSRWQRKRIAAGFQ